MYSDGPPDGSPDQELQKSLHATTLGALKARMDKNGIDVQKAAEAVIVFTYHIWEEKYRRNLATHDGTPFGEISSDIMGDLRLLRNAIIHNKGIASNDMARCKVVKHFPPGQRIILSDNEIYTILRAIRHEFGSCA